MNEIPIANLTGRVEEVESPCTEDTLFFCLQEGNNQFRIGLSSVIECLVFASENGDIPELPAEWLNQIRR